MQVLQSTDFSYLDPARGWDGGVNAFYRLIYRQLITKAPNDAKDPNAMVPDLAQSLGKVSADGLSWTYELKGGIKFDTGAPITSKDVKFGISRGWDPEIGIGAPYLKQLIDAPKGYQGRTARVTCRRSRRPTTGPSSSISRRRSPSSTRRCPSRAAPRSRSAPAGATRSSRTSSPPVRTMWRNSPRAA